MTKKSLKRMIIASLAASAVIALAACSTSGGTSSSGSITKDTKATLNLWTYNPQTAGTATDETREVAQFKKLYPNVTVKITFIPEAQFSNKVIASATTKSGPDILWINGAYTQTYAQAKVVENFDPYWKSYADASQFPASVIGSYDGGKYSVQTYVNLNALWYNKSILDEYKLPVPTTLDELESDLATIKADGKYAGLQLTGTTGVEGEWISKPFFSAFGVTSYKNYGDSGTKDMFDLLTGWESKGYIPKETVGQSQTDGVNTFIAGKTAFYVGGNWQLGQAQKAGLNFGVIGMPSGPKGPGTVYLGGQAEAIGAFSTNKDLAWKFLEQTWLTKSFEGDSLANGSIPARADAIPADVDANIKAYAEALKQGVALSSDTASTLAIGNLWSGVLAGQSTPAQAQETGKQIAATAK